VTRFSSMKHLCRFCTLSTISLSCIMTHAHPLASLKLEQTSALIDSLNDNLCLSLIPVVLILCSTTDTVGAGIEQSVQRLWVGRHRDRSSSPIRLKNHFFSTFFRRRLRSIQTPIVWVPTEISPGVKRSER
jgi:branched-subunit amino acid transport protein AzlD